MKDIDELIGRALTAEDRALLASHAEPGYFRQALGTFRGPTGWVVWVVYVMSTAAFVAGLWAMWRLWGSADPTDAVRWGVLALALFQVTMMSKGYLGTRMEANRMLREVKRVELQLSLLREEISSGRS